MGRRSGSPREYAEKLTQHGNYHTREGKSNGGRSNGVASFAKNEGSGESGESGELTLWFDAVAAGGTL